MSNTGMGDYMVANWGPPRMNNGLFSAMAEAPGTPWGGAWLGWRHDYQLGCRHSGHGRYPLGASLLKASCDSGAPAWRAPLT